MTSDQIKALQTQLNQQGANLKVDGVLGPLTSAAMNKAIATSVAQNPALAHLTAQNDPGAIVNAYTSGNWSSVVDNTGKPFSDEDQRMAVEKSKAALQPGFDEAQRNEEFTTANSLKDKVDTYNDYISTQGAKFQADKENLDQNAANNGVLFSGGRVQREQNLKNTYDTAQKTKADSVSSDISKLGNDFQYKYGNEAAGTPKLSQYYQLGKNSFNPSVARGGVTSGDLSSVYNTGSRNYQGTVVNANKAATQVRAASLLGNKANKIVPYGYQTQL